MAAMTASKDRDEVTATPPTPKAAWKGEATPERRSASAAAASPRGGTPGAARSPAASLATGHAGTAGTPRRCWGCEVREREIRALEMGIVAIQDRVSILKERARDDVGTPAERSGLRAELEELKEAYDATQAEQHDLEGAVQKTLTANEDLRARARTLKTEKCELEERLAEALKSRPERGGTRPSAVETTEHQRGGSTPPSAAHAATGDPGSTARQLGDGTPAERLAHLAAEQLRIEKRRDVAAQAGRGAREAKLAQEHLDVGTRHGQPRVVLLQGPGMVADASGQQAVTTTAAATAGAALAQITHRAQGQRGGPAQPAAIGRPGTGKEAPTATTPAPAPGATNASQRGARRKTAETRGQDRRHHHGEADDETTGGMDDNIAVRWRWQ